MWAVARVRISKRRISMQGKIYSFSSMSVNQSSNIRKLLRFKLTHFHFSVVLRIGCLMLWDDHFSVKSWSVPLQSSITTISIANQFNSYKDNHKNGKYSNTTFKVYLMYYFCRIYLVLWICIDIFIWYLRFDAPHHIRDKYMERYFDYQNYSKYKVPSLDAFDRNNVDDVLNFIRWFFWYL